ncbi:MAG: biotin/lipoyl-binding protein [Candidatus Bathyarchaeota archaeon]|jgi:biotin carboxyl carrier protein
MKRKFKVTVDGHTYTVEVEELRERDQPVSSKRAELVKPQFTERKKVEKHKLMEVSGVIVAPLPGVVSEVRVKKGDSVETGDILLILEAMKMENEIHAHSSGLVEEIFVEAGDKVERSAPLVKLS